LYDNIEYYNASDIKDMLYNKKNKHTLNSTIKEIIENKNKEEKTSTASSYLITLNHLEKYKGTIRYETINKVTGLTFL
jgi:hypothetical protein